MSTQKNFELSSKLNIFVSTNEANEVTGVLLCRLQEKQNHNVLLDSKTLWVEDTCVSESHRGKFLYKPRLTAKP